MRQLLEPSKIIQSVSDRKREAAFKHPVKTWFFTHGDHTLSQNAFLAAGPNRRVFSRAPARFSLYREHGPCSAGIILFMAMGVEVTYNLTRIHQDGNNLIKVMEFTYNRRWG